MAGLRWEDIADTAESEAVQVRMSVVHSRTERIGSWPC